MGFTKIFKMLNSSVTNSSSAYNISNLPFKDIGGTEHTTVYASTSSSVNPTFLFSDVVNTVTPAVSVNSTTYPYTYLLIGSGDTPFTDTDYALDNRLVAGITFNTSAFGKATYDSSLGKSIRTATFTINTTTDITIKEIGLARYVYTSSSQGYLALLYREVLDTPITLAAGQSVTLALSVVGG